MSEFIDKNKNFNDFSEDQIEFIRMKIKSPDEDYDSFLNEFCSGFIRHSKLKLTLDNKLIECSKYLNSDAVTKLLLEKNVYNIYSYVLKSSTLIKFNEMNGININEYFTIFVHDVIKKFNYEDKTVNIYFDEKVKQILKLKEETKSLAVFNRYSRMCFLMLLNLSAINLEMCLFLDNNSFAFDLAFICHQWFIYQTFLKRENIEYDKISKQMIEVKNKHSFETIFVICRILISQQRFGSIFHTEKFHEMISSNAAFKITVQDVKTYICNTIPRLYHDNIGFKFLFFGCNLCVTYP